MTVWKCLLVTLPLFNNLVLVTGVAFSAQAIIDLLFSVKHSLTRATLYKYLYVCTQIVHRLYLRLLYLYVKLRLKPLLC